MGDAIFARFTWGYYGDWIMEIGFPFMGIVSAYVVILGLRGWRFYSFIFSFLWVSFPRYSYSFVPAIAAVAARAVIPKVVGRVLVRRFAANDAIYTASQLTATRVFVGRAAANAAEYLPAASSYKMSGVGNVGGYCCCCIIFCSVFFEFIWRLGNGND